MRQDSAALLDADMYSRLAAPGHDYQISHARIEWARATLHEVRCHDCGYGRTRAVQDRDEAAVLARIPDCGPGYTATRRTLARRAVLAPLLDDYAAGHLEQVR